MKAPHFKGQRTKRRLVKQLCVATALAGLAIHAQAQKVDDDEIILYRDFIHLTTSGEHLEVNSTNRAKASNPVMSFTDRSELQPPTIDWNPVGSKDKVHTFNGSHDLDEQHQIASPAVSNSDKIKNSYGFQFENERNFNDPSKFSNNTLVAHTLEGVQTMFATTGNYESPDDDLTYDNNKLLISGENSTLTKQWVSSDWSSEVWNAASIAAVIANYAASITHSLTALKNTQIQLGESYAKNSFLLAAATVTATLGDQTNQLGNFSHNTLYLEDTSIVGHTAGYGESAYLLAFSSPMFSAGDQTYPKLSTLDSNQIWVVSSQLDVAAILTGYLYGWNKASVTNCLLAIQNSTVNLNFRDVPLFTTLAGSIGVMGGASEGRNNKLYIANSTINYSNTGSVTSAKISSFYYAETLAQGNTVQIIDSDLKLQGSKNNVYFYGGALNNRWMEDQNNQAINNAIIIQGVQKQAQILGDAPITLFAGRINAAGEQTGNQILIDNVKVENKSTIAAFMFYEGTVYNTKATASQNITTIQNSEMTGPLRLYGGYFAGDPTYTESKQVELKNNKLLIQNSTLTDPTSKIYAVLSKAKGASQALDFNTVEIGKNVKGANQGVLKLDSIYGAYDMFNENYWGTGNELIIRSPIEVINVLSGFQVFTFDLTDYQPGTPFITFKGPKAHVLNTKEGDSERSSFVILSAPKDLMGQDIVLLHSENGFATIDTETGKTTDLEAGDHSDLLGDANDVVTYQTLARQSRVSMSPDDMSLVIEENGTDASQDLVLTMEGGQWSDEANDQTSALMESALSSLGALTAADDLFMDQALRDQVLTQEGPFVAARTGRWSFDTNTRIESNITSAVMGYGHEVGEGTHVGLFVEMGLGAYKTRTGLSDGTTSQGSGSQNYAGLGLFAMHKLPIEGLLLNGYVKAGGLQNHFDITMMNQGLSFNRTAAYWGANLGVMFDYPLTTNVSSRSYLQYFYDGMGSQTFDKVAADLAITSSFHYDAMNAHRIQLGTQVTYNYQPNLKPFIGIAIEDAIEAKATGTATDNQGTLTMKPSDMEGVTALLSAGWKYESEDQGLNVGLSATGYGGARNGVSAQVQATWAF